MKRLAHWVLLAVITSVIYALNEHVPAIHKLLQSPLWWIAAVFFFIPLWVVARFLNWRKRRRELQARRYALVLQQQTQPAYRVMQQYEERIITIRRGERGVYD